MNLLPIFFSTGLSQLLHIFNISWRTDKFPTTWKHDFFSPITKVGKDLSLLCSYRPISLLSHLMKLLEWLINSRLTWWLQTTFFHPYCTISIHREAWERSYLPWNISSSTHTALITVFIDLLAACDSFPWWHTDQTGLPWTPLHVYLFSGRWQQHLCYAPPPGRFSSRLSPKPYTL